MELRNKVLQLLIFDILAANPYNEWQDENSDHSLCKLFMYCAVVVVMTKLEEIDLLCFFGAVNWMATV